MRFVETPVFTKRVKDLLQDDEYRTLQVALLLRPDQGPLIKGDARSGGRPEGQASEVEFE